MEDGERRRRVRRCPTQSDLQARVFIDDETFHSNFMAVRRPRRRSTPRFIGRMTLLQEVPTDGVGVMAQWSQGDRDAAHLLAPASTGAGWTAPASSRASTPLTGTHGDAAARRRAARSSSSGAFVQGQFWPHRTALDHAQRPRGPLAQLQRPQPRDQRRHRACRPPTSRTLPDRDDTVVQPARGGAVSRHRRVSAWGSIGSGFRAPTLNELYRQFRVGAVLTLANDQLGPERLVGGELGVNIAPADELHASASTWFDNRMKNPVSNVTIGHQHSSSGRTSGGRASGAVQNDVEYRVGRDWRVGAGYLFNQAKVTEFAANPALVGKYLPQVPKHRGSVSVAYSNPRIVTLSSRRSGLRPPVRRRSEHAHRAGRDRARAAGLRRRWSSRRCASIGRNLDVFFGVQNLLDQEYIVQLRCRRPSARRAWSTAASASAGRAG